MDNNKLKLSGEYYQRNPRLILEDKPWEILIIKNHGTIDCAITVGFSRYNMPELRIDSRNINGAPYALAVIAAMHEEEELHEGAFECEELPHPSGEVFRLYARKCPKEQQYAISDVYTKLCEQLGNDAIEEFYIHGILDIVVGDIDNLLPGEVGYNKNLDLEQIKVSIH